MLMGARNTRSDDYGDNMGLKQVSLNVGQIGLQPDFFVLDAQLRPDVVPVEIDRALRQVHGLCDLLGSFALVDKIGDFKLGGRKPQHFGGQAARERRHDLVQIGFQDLRIRLLLGIQFSPLEFVQIRQDQLIDRRSA